MNKEHVANMSLIFGWIFTSIKPDLILQLLSGAGTVLAAVNYWYSIREKRATLRKEREEQEKKEQSTDAK